MHRLTVLRNEGKTRPLIINPPVRAADVVVVGWRFAACRDPALFLPRYFFLPACISSFPRPPSPPRFRFSIHASRSRRLMDFYRARCTSPVCLTPFVIDSFSLWERVKGRRVWTKMRKKRSLITRKIESIFAKTDRRAARDTIIKVFSRNRLLFIGPRESSR